uniref:HAD-IC family P-type ATPase n=1 Tax=uncultured Marinobacter sp. TaxID=187379 RepID=UPI002589772F
GAGGMVAGLWLALHGRNERMTAMVLGSVLITCLTLAAFAATHAFWIAVVLVAVAAAGMTMTSTGSQMLIQNAVDGAMRGRGMSIYGLTWRGAPALGALGMGGLSSWVGLQAPVAGGAVLCLVIWGLILPRRRALAAGLEQHSEHPLAEAILARAKEDEVSVEAVTGFEALNGKGVQGEFNGEPVRLGNRRWLEAEGLSVDALNEAAQAITREAGTPLFLASGQQVLGVIGVADAIKPDSEAAIRRLHDAGIKVMMVTGDVDATARAIAAKSGIDDYRAEVLPEDKAEVVSEMRGKGYTVAMVGDGINDAPALAAADVGFAIGTGTDVAIESASITLMRGSLHGVPDAIEISRATVKNIHQNLFGAFIYNSLGIPVAAGLLYPVWGILMSPILAGAAMSLSSVTVVSNANRLRLFKTSQPQVSAEERN